MRYCIVYFGDDDNLKQRVIDITNPDPTQLSAVPATNARIGSDGGVYEWMDDDGRYYRTHHRSLPFLDLRTQMAEFRAFLGLEQEQARPMNAIIKHGGNPDTQRKLLELFEDLDFGSSDAIRITDGKQAPGGRGTYSDYARQIHNHPNHQLIDATTEWHKVLALFGKSTHMKEAIIHTHGNTTLSNTVQKLAYKAGHKWASGPAGQYTSMQAIRYKQGESMTYAESAYYRTHHPRALHLDAATEMDKIKLFFAGKLEIPVTIENFVMPKLLELIRSNPKDELTVGFIRRDLGMALPPEVQAQGADSICAWILEQKKSQQPTVSAEAHKPRSNKFKISLEYSVSGRWYRTDQVDYEGEVPQSVVDRAVAENDYEIIEDWLIENRDGLRELDRHIGDSSNGEEDDESYEGLPDEPNHLVESQFDDLTGN